MKVTRKIPSISMHLSSEGTGKMETTAESASPGATAQPRPSSGGGGGGGGGGRGMARGPGGRKRAKSGSGGPPIITTEGRVVEGGPIGRLSDLKLREAKDTAESAKKSCDGRGRGKGSRQGRGGSRGNQNSEQMQVPDTTTRT